MYIAIAVDDALNAVIADLPRAILRTFLNGMHDNRRCNAILVVCEFGAVAYGVQVREMVLNHIWTPRVVG